MHGCSSLPVEFPTFGKIIQSLTFETLPLFLFQYPASEKDAVELRKKIEDTYGEITDVIASIGRGVEIDDIFDQSLENFRDVRH